MQGYAKKRWVELCQQAAVEQDSKKLLKLVQEIDRLLREKQERLESAHMNNTRPGHPTSTNTGS
jgi:hypothetical protein